MSKIDDNPMAKGQEFSSFRSEKLPNIFDDADDLLDVSDLGGSLMDAKRTNHKVSILG